jgi:hypothetical protein
LALYALVKGMIRMISLFEFLQEVDYVNPGLMEKEPKTLVFSETFEELFTASADGAARKWDSIKGILSFKP